MLESYSRRRIADHQWPGTFKPSIQFRKALTFFGFAQRFRQLAPFGGSTGSISLLPISSRPRYTPWIYPKSMACAAVAGRIESFIELMMRGLFSSRGNFSRLIALNNITSMALLCLVPRLLCFRDQTNLRRYISKLLRECYRRKDYDEAPTHCQV